MRRPETSCLAERLGNQTRPTPNNAPLSQKSGICTSDRTAGQCALDSAAAATQAKAPLRATFPLFS